MKRFIYGLDTAAPEACAKALCRKGYDTVVASCAQERVISAVRGAGLDYILCVPAFSLDRDHPVHAVDSEGQERIWFGSGCPNDGALREKRLEEYRSKAALSGVSALWVDGARFASFASSEGPEAFFTCFCPVCMQKAERLGVDPAAMKAGAQSLLRFTRGEGGDAQEALAGIGEWLRFRRLCVNEFFDAFSAAVHDAGKRAGAFVFPASLCLWTGQEEAAAHGLDDLSPMLYRRYQHIHGPACLNHEWAALLGLFTERTGLSRKAAEQMLHAPQNTPSDVLSEGFAPAQIASETRSARTSGARLAPILQLEDDRLIESVRSALSGGAGAVGVFAYKDNESAPDLRPGFQED